MARLILASVTALTLVWVLSHIPQLPAFMPRVQTEDPAEAVQFVWTNGGRLVGVQELQLQGGTLERMPDQVRLLDPNGQVIATSATTLRWPLTNGICGNDEGVVYATLPFTTTGVGLPFGANDGYRIEAHVSGVWHPTYLKNAGCITSRSMVPSQQ